MLSKFSSRASVRVYFIKHFRHLEKCTIFGRFCIFRLTKFPLKISGLCSSPTARARLCARQARQFRPALRREARERSAVRRRLSTARARFAGTLAASCKQTIPAPARRRLRRARNQDRRAPQALATFPHRENATYQLKASCLLHSRIISVERHMPPRIVCPTAKISGQIFKARNCSHGRLPCLRNIRPSQHMR